MFCLFNQDITEKIARYAIGYPRDRISDMMKNVQRTVFGVHDGWLDMSSYKFVQWSEGTFSLATNRPGYNGGCKRVLVRQILAILDHDSMEGGYTYEIIEEEPCRHFEVLPHDLNFPHDLNLLNHEPYFEEIMEP